MSLVLEALRRVEKPGPGTGSIGAAVASYTPARPRRSLAFPLLLGLVTGGAVVLLFGPSPDGPRSQAGAAAQPVRVAKGRAGLPPPLFPEPGPSPAIEVRRPEASALDVRAEPSRRVDRATGPDGASPILVLQAISERDSRPIAIINDQLVKEGDKLGSVRVLKIGPDSVEVLLENGNKDTVRFAPPPRPEESPSPGGVPTGI